MASRAEAISAAASRSTGVVVWFTGRPASGKSTLAGLVRASLVKQCIPCVVLDSDEVRAAIVPAHGYAEEARNGFYATLTNLATLLSRQGAVVLVPATAHRREYRDVARAEAGRFIEVYVDTPAWECERRDPKGLYQRSIQGSVRSLPGASIAYQPPMSAEVVARGGYDRRAVERIVQLLREQDS